MKSLNPDQMAIRISITGRCQMHCYYCTRENHSSNQLEYSQLAGIIEALAQGGFRNVHWTGGEPLCRPDLEMIVAHARRAGFSYQKLTTNGAGLAKRADSLCLAGINRVNVSLDSLDRDQFNGLTGSALYDHVLAGIEEARRRFRCVKLNVCVTRQNVSELGRFISFAEQLGDGIVVKFLELVPCQNHFEHDRESFYQEFVSIQEIMSTLYGTFGQIVPSSSPEHSRQKCQYFKIVTNNVVFGLNPNESIEYACQREQCADFRMSPTGYLSDCSVNLTNAIFLPDLNFDDQKTAIQELIHKKRTRTTEEWEVYRHKQQHYSFWRFGEMVPELIPFTKSACQENGM